MSKQKAGALAQISKLFYLSLPPKHPQFVFIRYNSTKVENQAQIAGLAPGN
jgi:hypothetical protein